MLGPFFSSTRNSANSFTRSTVRMSRKNSASALRKNTILDELKLASTVASLFPSCTSALSPKNVGAESVLHKTTNGLEIGTLCPVSRAARWPGWAHVMLTRVVQLLVHRLVGRQVARTHFSLGFGLHLRLVVLKLP